MSQPGCFVQGIATAVPVGTLTARQSIELMRPVCPTERTARLLRRIVRLTGIETRHLAALDYQFGPDGEHRFYLPAAAQPGGPGMGARQALFDQAAGRLVQRTLAAFDPAQLAALGMLVTSSCTHASAPGLERAVFRHPAVPTDVQRWNLGFMGCSAALAALRFAHDLVAVRGPALLLACELSSLHFQYSDDIDQVTANVLFADGAAGMLVSNTPSPVRVVDCRCASLPDLAEQMVWFADDHGLRLNLSPELPDTLGMHLPAMLAPLLAEHGLKTADVRHWVVHPGGPQILDSVSTALQLPDDALDLSREILRRYGNMSSPTVLFILKELLAARPVGPCVLLAFGPGLTIEAALLQLTASG